MESILCYDTLTGTYITIEVSEELATYLRRSYWREDIQQRRYYKRMLPIEEGCISNQITPEDYILEREQKYMLEKIVSELNKDEYELYYLRFVQDRTLKVIAEHFGISISYAAKKVMKLKKRLVELWIEVDEQI